MANINRGGIDFNRHEVVRSFSHVKVEDADLSNCQQCGVAMAGMFGESVAITDTKLVPWGDDNQLPHKLIRAVINDSQSMPAIERLVSYLLGTQRISAYNAVSGTDVEVDNAQMKSWLRGKRREIGKYLELCANNLIVLGNAFVLIETSKKGEVTIKGIDATLARAHYPNDMKIEPSKYSVLYNTFGSKHKLTKVDYDVLPDDYTPKSYKDTTFIMHLRPQQTGAGIYATPVWLGSMPILETRGLAVRTLRAVLKNAHNIQLIVTISDQYYEGIATDEEKTEKYQQLITRIDEFFAGADNSGKALFLKSWYDQASKKENQYVTIQTFEDKTDYLGRLGLLLETASSQSVSFGINPTLLGVQTKNQLPSGGEMFYSDNHQLARGVTLLRTLLLDPISRIFDGFGWHHDVLKIFDVIITQLENDPKGIQPSTVQ